MRQLRPYQEQAISQIACSIAKNKKIIFQLATGGGKTVVMANIIKRFLDKSDKKVLCLVHRQELKKQIDSTIQSWFFGLEKYDIMMVETFNRRQMNTSDIGLVIIDEAHIGNFKKVFDRFCDDTYILGFTATPLGQSKKDPLKNYFNDIVCSEYDIPELIQQGALVQNITFIKDTDIQTDKFAITNGDYNQKDMFDSYSQPKCIESVVKAYFELCHGKKTMIYNVNCEHSKLVCDALLKHNLDVKHLDAKATPDERTKIWEWYKNTDDAVLCNVGIATTGTDVPSIHNIIFNRSTLSLPLWLQCCGRGARPYQNKNTFTIIDLGCNAQRLGDWQEKRNWKQIFEKPKAPGIAPTRICTNCEAMIPLGHTKCHFCGEEYPREKQIQYETELANFIAFGSIEPIINVDNIISYARVKGYKDYWCMFEIAKQLKRSKKPQKDLLEDYQKYVKNFVNKIGKRFNEWHKEKCVEIFEKAFNTL